MRLLGQGKQARRQLTICEKEISAQETVIAEIEQRLLEAAHPPPLPAGEYQTRDHRRPLAELNPLQ